MSNAGNEARERRLPAGNSTCNFVDDLLVVWTSGEYDRDILLLQKQLYKLAPVRHRPGLYQPFAQGHFAHARVNENFSDTTFGATQGLAQKISHLRDIPAAYFKLGNRLLAPNSKPSCEVVVHVGGILIAVERHGIGEKSRAQLACAVAGAHGYARKKEKHRHHRRAARRDDDVVLPFLYKAKEIDEICGVKGAFLYVKCYGGIDEVCTLLH